MQQDPTPRQHFAYILPSEKQWFSTKEVAEILGRTPQHVRNAFEGQQLLGHTLCVHNQEGMPLRKRHQVTREALLLYLFESANYKPEDFLARIEEVLQRLSKKELKQVKSRIRKYLE